VKSHLQSECSAKHELKWICRQLFAIGTRTFDEGKSAVSTNVGTFGKATQRRDIAREYRQRGTPRSNGMNWKNRRARRAARATRA